MRKYDLEYRFVPSLVDAYNKGELPGQALVDISWWEHVLKDMGNNSFEFNFSDIKVDPRILAKDTKAILYTFPEADISPLAKYGILLLDNKDKARYITFEKDLDPKVWFLGGQVGEVHSNYGSTEDCPTIEDFVSLIEERFLGVRKKQQNGKREGFRLFRKLLNRYN